MSGGARTISIGVVAFAISRTEVNKLLTKVDLLFIGVLIQLLELGELPLALLGFLLLLAFLLLCTDLGSYTVTLLLKFAALLIAFFSLLLVLLVALRSLHDHFLGLLDPLDVLDHGLLDLVVAKAPIEALLQVVLLLLKPSLLFEALLNLAANVCQIILLELLGIVKDRLLLLD